MTKFENATASTVRSFFAAFGSRAATVLGLTALFLLPFTFLVKPTPAAATTAQIEVTTGAFKGGWAIGSPSPKSFGPATIELETGQQHTVFVGTIGHFTINVDGNGDVTVLNGVSAQGGMGTLDFDTLEISVDPGLFPGRWIIFGGG